MGCAGSREDDRERSTAKACSHPDDEATSVRDPPATRRPPVTVLSVRREGDAEEGAGAGGVRGAALNRLLPQRRRTARETATLGIPSSSAVIHAAAAAARAGHSPYAGLLGATGRLSCALPVEHVWSVIQPQVGGQEWPVGLGAKGTLARYAAVVPMGETGGEKHGSHRRWPPHGSLAAPRLLGPVLLPHLYGPSGGGCA